MNILLDQSSPNKVTKSDSELVEQEKHEYHLIGTYLRTPGLSLFGYSSVKDELIKLEVKRKESLQLEIDNNELKTSGTASEECTVDSKMEYFEALNMKSATKRVDKFKQGKIKTLSNLRSPNDKGINSLKLF